MVKPFQVTISVRNFWSENSSNFCNSVNCDCLSLCHVAVNKVPENGCGHSLASLLLSDIHWERNLRLTFGVNPVLRDSQFSSCYDCDQLGIHIEIEWFDCFVLGSDCLVYVDQFARTGYSLDNSTENNVEESERKIFVVYYHVKEGNLCLQCCWIWIDGFRTWKDSKA